MKNVFSIAPNLFSTSFFLVISSDCSGFFIIDKIVVSCSSNDPVFITRLMRSTKPFLIPISCSMFFVSALSCSICSVSLKLYSTSMAMGVSTNSKKANKIRFLKVLGVSFKYNRFKRGLPLQCMCLQSFHPIVIFSCAKK
ncbi:hypothetical protein D3C71_1768750 [compost metagenome]